MSRQKIKIEVEGLKLEPLKFFMEKQGKKLEEEIVAEMDRMYEKYVPAQAREFIDHQIQDENPGAVHEEQQNAATGSKRTRNKRSRTQSTENNQESIVNSTDTSEQETVQESASLQQM